MKLEEAKTRLCAICLEAPVDPDRDDDLCSVCGDVADKYAEDEEETLMGYQDYDCGC